MSTSALTTNILLFAQWVIGILHLGQNLQCPAK